MIPHLLFVITSATVAPPEPHVIDSLAMYAPVVDGLAEYELVVDSFASEGEE